MGRVRQGAPFETRYIPDSASGCWIWQGSRNTSGYGCLTHRYKNYRAHRFSWIIYRGEIPSGMWVLHHCDNPLCVRPDHLFLGTAADNTADMVKKGRDRFRNSKGRKINVGAKHPMAKLTGAQVLTIRADSRILREIARDYGVSQSTVSVIKNRQHWAHLP